MNLIQIQNSISFCSILFYLNLLYSIFLIFLFYYFLFYSIPFILFYPIPFLFYSILFHPFQFNSILVYFFSFLRWLLLPISLPFTYHLSRISILMYPAPFHISCLSFIVPLSEETRWKSTSQGRIQGGISSPTDPAGRGWGCVLQEGPEKSVLALSRLLSWTNCSLKGGNESQKRVSQKKTDL